MKDLFEACRRINGLASQLDHATPGSLSHIQLSILIDREIGLIYRHLFRLSRANLLEMMGLLLKGVSGPADDVDEEARRMVVPLIDIRTSTGRREIVHAITSLFGQNPSARENDVLKYLNGTIRRTISRMRREALREANPLFLSTCRKVEYYIANSERYERRDGIVHDGYTTYEIPGLSFADVEDLITLCASVNPPPSSVAETVETIFGRLSDANSTFRSALHLRDLQTATYRILEPILIDQSQCRSPLTPEEEYLLHDHERTLREIAQEMTRGYQWRKPFDTETQLAFTEACLEYYLDKTCRGKSLSRFQYLSAYLPNCTRETYEKTYKPSFQHFIRLFEERWRKKTRAEE